MFYIQQSDGAVYQLYGAWSRPQAWRGSLGLRFADRDDAWALLRLIWPRWHCWVASEDREQPARPMARVGEE